MMWKIRRIEQKKIVYLIKLVFQQNKNDDHHHRHRHCHFTSHLSKETHKKKLLKIYMSFNRTEFIFSLFNFKRLYLRCHHPSLDHSLTHHFRLWLDRLRLEWFGVEIKRKKNELKEISNDNRVGKSNNIRFQIIFSISFWKIHQTQFIS